MTKTSIIVMEDLLSYYRELAENFEKEREDFLERLEQVSVTRSEHQQVSSSLTQKDDQIRQLQKALSDAHLYLFDEREHVLKLTAENDELRVREKHDRQRIQHWLISIQPVENDFEDQRPALLAVSCL